MTATDPAGGHPLLGRRLPPHELDTPAGTTDTATLLHAGRGVLLDLAGDAGLRRAPTPWRDRVTVVTVVAARPAAPLAATAALLVRPDGHVAWAATTRGDRDGDHEGGLRDALHRWFGLPTPQERQGERCIAR